MPVLHPVMRVTVNGITRRVENVTTSLGLRSAFSTATVTAVATEEPAQPIDRIEAAIGYVEEGGPVLVFGGEADDDSRKLFPNQPGISCSGFLARLQRPSGVEQEGAPRDSEGNLPAYYAENVTDVQIVTALLNLYGVPIGDIQGDDPVQTFGTLDPVRLEKNQPAWALLSELDRLTFMRTFDGPDGLVRRVPVNTKPASPALTLSETDILLPSGSRTRSRRPIINRVTMKGLTLTTGVAPFAERYADAPVINGRSLIPDPPKYQVEEWQSDLAETEECCDRYAARRLDQMNRLSEAIQVPLVRCRPDIRPGMSVALDAPHLGYDSRYVMWVEQVEHSANATAAHTTLGLIVATAEAGINPNVAPIPVIRYTIEQEYADGQRIWIVRADGRDSYDPDGEAIDLDPQHGIFDYLWDGTPEGPTTPAGLPQATYVYTSDPTGAQICLTVADVHLKLATACVTITAKDVADAVVRDLWAAVTTDLLLSTDGGGTWAGVGVAAVGCCEQAHPSYQLAWTASGDLWKVTLADDGLTYEAALVLAGKGITAASINTGIDGTGTKRCWAAGAGRIVHGSGNDGEDWAAVGTIPPVGESSNTINHVEESPFAAGDLSAICGSAIVHSFDNGRTWTVLRKYADDALTATRMASGRYGHLSIPSRSYRWAIFSGTSGNTMSRLLESGSQADVDWPTPDKPAQPTGLTLGLDTPTIYATDTQEGGRTWRLDDFTGGGELVEMAYETDWGTPQHIVRDGAIPELIYGAALGAIWKSYDGFLSVVRLLELTGGWVGKMVGSGRLRHAPVPEGNLYASVMLATTNQARIGRTTCKIVRLVGTTWEDLGDHPIPVADNGTLRGGIGRCAFAACTMETSHGYLETSIAYPRPLVRDLAGNFYTYAFAIFSEDVIGCTPGLNNLYKSTDNCATWDALTGVSGVTALDVAADGALWAVAEDGKTVRKSTDHGATWTTILAERPGVLNPTFDPPGPVRYLDRWTGIACSPSSALSVAVATGYYGYARTANGTTFSFVKKQSISFVDGGYGVARTPVDGATLIDRRRSFGYTTFRVPDGVADADADGSFAYAVLGQTSPNFYGAGNDHPNGYRRFGGRVAYLGTNLAAGTVGGATWYSADDGNSWGLLIGQDDTDALAAGVAPASRDVGYDAATDTLYAGLALPVGDDTSIAFVKKVGPLGAWTDLTGGMVADLGGVYAVHLLGMVVGVSG